MLKGVITAFAIILLSIPIPVVHFIAIPVSPFIAGFIGGGIARADEARIIWFGIIVGSLMLIPAAIIIFIWQVLDVDQFLNAPTWFWAIVGIAIAPYTWFGTTIGALTSYGFRSKQQRHDGPA